MSNTQLKDEAKRLLDGEEARLFSVATVSQLPDLSSALDELDQVSESLSPADCKEVLMADRKIRKVLERGGEREREELIPAIEEQLMACKMLQPRCPGECVKMRERGREKRERSLY